MRVLYYGYCLPESYQRFLLKLMLMPWNSSYEPTLMTECRVRRERFKVLPGLLVSLRHYRPDAVVIFLPEPAYGHNFGLYRLSDYLCFLRSLSQCCLEEGCLCVYVPEILPWIGRNLGYACGFSSKIVQPSFPLADQVLLSTLNLTLHDTFHYIPFNVASLHEVDFRSLQKLCWANLNFFMTLATPPMPLVSSIPPVSPL